jgi:hypothetical protein
MTPEFGSFSDNVEILQAIEDMVRRGRVADARLSAVELQRHLRATGETKSTWWLGQRLERVLKARSESPRESIDVRCEVSPTSVPETG